MQGNNFLKWELSELVLLQNQFVFIPDVYNVNADRQIWPLEKDCYNLASLTIFSMIFIRICKLIGLFRD